MVASVDGVAADVVPRVLHSLAPSSPLWPPHCQSLGPAALRVSRCRFGDVLGGRLVFSARVGESGAANPQKRLYATGVIYAAGRNVWGCWPNTWPRLPPASFADIDPSQGVSLRSVDAAAEPVLAVAATQRASFATGRDAISSQIRGMPTCLQRQPDASDAILRP